MTRVLFVCVENSNRSQMAEAYAHMLGGDAVDVDVVDDRDVAGNQAFDQVLGAVAEAHPAFDRLNRRCPVAAREQGGKATATGGCHRSRLSGQASGEKRVAER